MRIGLCTAFLAATLPLLGCNSRELQNEPKYSDKTELLFHGKVKDNVFDNPKSFIFVDKFSNPFGINLTKEKIDSGEYDVIQLMPIESINQSRTPLSINIDGNSKFIPDSVSKRYFKDDLDNGNVNPGLNFKVETYEKTISVFVSPHNSPLIIYNQNDPKNPGGMKYIFHLDKVIKTNW